MDFQAIIQAISSVGFPCVMCIYLVHYMQTQQGEMRDTISELKEAIIKLTEKLIIWEKKS